MRIDVVCASCRVAMRIPGLRNPKSKNPAEAGFWKKLKLTDKPGSVVDSHSSRPAIAHWLKQPTRVQGHRRFALCCTGRGFPPQALPGTLPYGARTFLPSARLPRKGRRRSGDCLVSFGAQY